MSKVTRSRSWGAKPAGVVVYNRQAHLVAHKILTVRPTSGMGSLQGWRGTARPPPSPPWVSVTGRPPPCLPNRGGAIQVLCSEV